MPSFLSVFADLPAKEEDQHAEMTNATTTGPLSLCQTCGRGGDGKRPHFSPFLLPLSIIIHHKQTPMLYFNKCVHFFELLL